MSIGIDAIGSFPIGGESQVILSSEATFSASSGTTPSIVAKVKHKAVATVACGTTMFMTHSRRDLVMQTGTTPSMSTKVRYKATFAGLTSATPSVVSKTRYKAVFTAQSSMTPSIVARCRCLAKFRAYPKTKMDMISSGGVSKARFVGRSGTTIVMRTPHRVYTQMRGKSRTIMRIRTGPWPW